MRVSRRDNLDRYYLFKVFGYGVFVHYIHHDEERNVYHTHPWNAISFILGSYTEERLEIGVRTVRFLNVINAVVPHRVVLPNGPVWSLVIHGPRYNKWGVFNGNGKALDVEPWRGVGGRTSYNPD